MSELFPQVQMRKIQAPFIQNGKTDMNTAFIKAVNEEIRRQLDQRLLDQAKEIGLRNTMRR